MARTNGKAKLNSGTTIMSDHGTAPTPIHRNSCSRRGGELPGIFGGRRGGSPATAFWRPTMPLCPMVQARADWVRGGEVGPEPPVPVPPSERRGLAAAG